MALRPYVNGPLGLLPSFCVPMLERLLADRNINHALQITVLHVLALVQEEVYYEEEVDRLVASISEGIEHVGVTQATMFLWCCYRLGIDDGSVVDHAMLELLHKFQTTVPRRQR